MDRLKGEVTGLDVPLRSAGRIFFHFEVGIPAVLHRKQKYALRSLGIA